MFAWYRAAQVCYAYMYDVPGDIDPPASSHSSGSEWWVGAPGGMDPLTSSYFSGSEWFRRGWTLQELIAPQNMVFYSQAWAYLGNKSDLHETLSKITRIDRGILLGATRLDSISIATRMSWAAARETTPIEDEAYCLMGLFDVNMPIIYGEGVKEFIRLQEEIIKESDDESLFAWVDKDALPDSLHGLLARAPQTLQTRETSYRISAQTPASRSPKRTRGCEYLSTSLRTTRNPISRLL